MRNYDDVDWYCDECDAYLNNQIGFNTSSGRWTCTNCGCENDVTEDNILSDEEAEYVTHEECMKCGGHMIAGQGYIGDVWVCEDCGCEAVRQDGVLWFETDDDDDNF